MPMTSRFVVRLSVGLLSLGLAALLLIVCATIWLGGRAQQHLSTVIELRDLRIASNLLRVGLLAAESSQRGFVMTGNEIYLAPFENAKASAQTELEAIVRGLSRQPQRAAMVLRLIAVTNDKISEMTETIALKVAGQDADAMAIIRSNRGKALMDEANVFISAIVLDADERLTAGVAEQNANAALLRLTAVGAGLAILLVASGVIFTAVRYTKEITVARDEVRKMNESLEERVERRTAELGRARDRAELLLTEVNHRVSNSLTLVASLVRLQAGGMTDQSAKSALSETESRIQAIAQMHRHLFTSGEVGLVALDEYLNAILAQLEAALAEEKSGVTLRRSFEPIKLVTSEAINLGIVLTEWVTNAFKYAYADRRGEVRVRLGNNGRGVELVVEDDGAGRIDQKPAQGTGLGTKIVSAIAASMNAEISYRQRHPGTGAHLLLPSRAKARA